MTKTDIVVEFGKKNNVSQDTAREYIDSLISIITAGLKKDKNVQITGFGTYKLKHIEEREGHNPKNVDEKIMIPAHNQVSFTTGAQLKADVNTASKPATKKAAKTIAKKKKKK
jgi:nucleoid DNA-binding protein